MSKKYQPIVLVLFYDLFVSVYFYFLYHNNALISITELRTQEIHSNFF